jgi:chromosome segregation ATPase
MHLDKAISIREARNALNQVNLKIPTFPIGLESREILEQTAIELESLIWKLVHEDLLQITEDLKFHQQRLQELNEKLKERTASLEKISKMIENVSHLIGSLTGLAG